MDLFTSLWYKAFVLVFLVIQFDSASAGIVGEN